MAQIRNEALRTQLLECAIRHFSQKGYVATNLMEIAEEVGVTRGPLYYYFSNKAELYQAASTYTIEQLKNRYNAILDVSKPIRDTLREDFECCLSNQNGLFAMQYAGPDMPDISGEWQVFRRWLLGKKKEVLTAAKARGELKPDCDIAELITFIYAFFQGMTHLNDLAKDSDGYCTPVLENATGLFMSIVSDRYLTDRA